MLFDPERRWIDRGACRSADPELFFPEGSPKVGKIPSEDVQQKWDKAKRVCARCPVLEECRRDTLGEESGVWGGQDERERWLMRGRLARATKRWDPKLRLAWGKELAALRDGGVGWVSLRLMTGFGQAAAEPLISEWEEHSAARRREAARRVVDLPLPELEGLKQKPFPLVDGSRHAWVRHNGIIADAHYRAETSDGEWIFVQIKAGRGNSMKWVPRHDVHIYRPQPRVVQPYINRPDTAEKRGLSA